MGIFQSDLTIKTAIELGMNDMRQNLWLLDDALSDATQNPWLKDKYGQKQIDAFKEWFANNQVDVYMRQREDKDRMPCITITIGSGSEKDEMKTMADQSTESVQLMPNQINKPIPYVVKPFPFTSYDDITGEIPVDMSIKGMNNVAAGMILVDPSTGKGYEILDITDDAFIIESDLDDVSPALLAVVPQHQYYTARREHTFFQETYNITCHAHGDPQTLLWLWTITMYNILRYRESMLEAQGFTQCSVSYGMMDDGYTNGSPEKVWARTIILTGMVENSWIKSPRRIIEKVVLREYSEEEGYTGGIKILSNSQPDDPDPSDVSWYPIDENAEDEEET